MSESFVCPRRAEDGTDDPARGYCWPDPKVAPDKFTAGHGLVSQRAGCSYCGSMSGDDFMQAVHDGVEVGPTDKDYKAYLGSMTGKVYFQHLSEDQRREFVDLLNAHKVNIGYPGHFYVLPFFARPA